LSTELWECQFGFLHLHFSHSDFDNNICLLNWGNASNQSLQRQASTRAKADQLLNERLTAPFTGDANDHLYQWDSSRDYNPIDQIDKIKATLLAINSADDERNPPELRVMERALARISNARLLLIPASDQTAGHGTTGQAKWWKQEVGALIQSAPYLK
jgi:homoserine O-acetyltransferase